MTKKEVYIVDAVRTPIGRFKGALKDVRPDDLAATVIKGLIARNPNIPISEIEEVVLGNANGAGEENRNVARMAALLADLPISVAGTTLNRLCGSGLDAVNYAARAILANEGDIFIAGGTESMTRAPFVMGKAESSYQRYVETYDTTIGWRFPHPKIEEHFGIDSMPQTAENIAQEYNISREEQDEFAQKSQMKAKRAMENNRFQEEIIPVEIKQRNGEVKVVDTDEHPRPTSTIEALSKLNPIFDQGTVTAGNASGINDGASVLLLMSKQKVEELGVKPLAKYVVSAVAGLEPRVMGLGPIYASRKALKRSGLQKEEIDLIELNEAFSSQAIECIKQLDLDKEIINVNGGSIAFGHPLGASGARILTTLIHEMQKREEMRYGLATMCIGVGQGIATIIEKV